MKVIANVACQVTGRWLNNRGVNLQLKTQRITVFSGQYTFL